MPTLEQLYAAHTGKLSDKWSSYLAEYERVFAPFRGKPVRLLEIGVQNGGSLEIWPRYFPNACQLVGCDIDPACAGLGYDDPRIALVIGDANTDAAQAAILEHSDTFDIIIEDGSHRSGDIVKSFARYFPRLADGGVYIAEDLHCSYWWEYGGGLYDPYSALAFFKRLLDAINHEHWGIGKPRGDIPQGFFAKYAFRLSEETLQSIHSLQFMNSLCAVHKAEPERNRLGHRVIAGAEASVEPALLGDHSRSTPCSDQTGNPWAMRNMPPDEELPHRLKVLAERDARIEAYDTQVRELRGRLQAQEALAGDLKAKLAARGAELDARDKELKERVQETKMLNERVANLEARLAALHSSFSWRMTAPLRALRRRLGF